MQTQIATYEIIGKRVRLLACVCLLSGISLHQAQANLSCEPLDPRTEVSGSQKQQIEGEVNTALKVAKAGGSVSNQAEKSTKNIISTQGDTESLALKERYLYLFCITVTQESTFSADKKVQLLNDLRQGILGSEAEPDKITSFVTIRDVLGQSQRFEDIEIYVSNKFSGRVAVNSTTPVDIVLLPVTGDVQPYFLRGSVASIVGNSIIEENIIGEGNLDLSKRREFYLNQVSRKNGSLLLEIKQKD